MAVTSLIYGFSYPLLALSLERQGVDETLIGLNTAAQGFAIFAVAPVASSAIRWLGPARLMLASVALSLALFLLLPVFPNVHAWFVIRFLLGSANSFLWIAGEAWINAVAEERTRGRVVGLYATALAAGFTLGPLVLAQTGSAGWLPFLVSAAMIAVSGVPLLFAQSLAPSMQERSVVRLLAFLWLAPTAMLANFTIAAADSALITFLPLYSMDLGLEESLSLYLITAMGLGGIACQVPIGWLADHMERRLLLAASVVALAVACSVMPLLTALTPWNWIVLFLVGGILGSLYTLGLILLGERFRGGELAGATAVFSSMWGIGSIVGLPIAGGAMDLLPPHGLPIALVVMFLAFLPFPVVSYVNRRNSATRH
jgi:MFS family permease